jgi:hypothetical protein
MIADNKKIIQLPKEIGIYLNSMKALELNLLICKKHGLSGDDIGKHTDLITSLFFKELSLKDLIEKIKQVFNFNDIKAKELAVDIAGIRLLVIDNWFNGEVSAYLKNLGVPAANYQKIVEEQKAAVEKEKEEDEKDTAEERAEKERLAKEELLPAPTPEPEVPENYKINWDEEAKGCLENFREGLVAILSFGDDMTEYNQIVVALLVARGQQFQGELEKALLSNNETITSALFSVDGKPAAPSIANWIKYFIKEKGSGIFNNIILTDFLVKSANAKILNEEEKGAVKKLLQLYRNLKFFPESMPNQTGEGWEIIPSAAGSAELEKARTVKTPVTNDTETETQRLIDREAARAIEVGPKLTELKAMAAAYPANSLQRKAIEDEINKINKK